MRAFTLLLFLTCTASAQTYLVENLSEHAVVANEVSMRLEGTTALDRGGRLETVPIVATGRHSYLERATSKSTTHRYYKQAQSETQIGIERWSKSLPESLRTFALIGDPHTASTTRPMTRDELSLVAEHFDACRIQRLLPRAAVQLNQPWPIDDKAVAGLCLFNPLSSHALQGKLVEVTDSTATFTLEGIASGFEHGSKIEATISARGEFDRKQQIVRSLRWEQTDRREQGPISPAMEARIVIEVNRSIEGENSGQLSDESIKQFHVESARSDPGFGQLLLHQHPEFTLHHDRAWHAVVDTEKHVVLRLVIGGELIAQATITPWQRAAADRGTKEFIAALAQQPGWVPQKIVEQRDITGASGTRIFRYAALGKQDGQEAEQAFHLITAKDGRQLVLTAVSPAAKASKLAGGDIELAKSLIFPAPK